MSPLSLSIVIPAYKEGQNLEGFVSQFLDNLPDQIKKCLLEVLIVENGGDQPTLEAARSLQARYPEIVKALSIQRASYGEAIKHGMLQAAGSHIAILECDFLYADYVAESLRVFQSTAYKFTVASKQHPESVDQRPIKRRFLTFAFNFVLRLYFGYPGTDTHGLKCIEAGLAKELCALAQTTDEVFQTEIVLLAWKRGYAVKELPMQIEEKRPAVVSIAKRLPKVMNMLGLLKKSLSRF